VAEFPQAGQCPVLGDSKGCEDFATADMAALSISWQLDRNRAVSWTNPCAQATIPFSCVQYPRHLRIESIWLSKRAFLRSNQRRLYRRQRISVAALLADSSIAVTSVPSAFENHVWISF
jgi:hypothetical protein